MVVAAHDVFGLLVLSSVSCLELRGENTRFGFHWLHLTVVVLTHRLLLECIVLEIYSDMVSGDENSRSNIQRLDQTTATLVRHSILEGVAFGELFSCCQGW